MLRKRFGGADVGSWPWISGARSPLPAVGSVPLQAAAAVERVFLLHVRRDRRVADLCGPQQQPQVEAGLLRAAQARATSEAELEELRRGQRAEAASAQLLGAPRFASG